MLKAILLYVEKPEHFNLFWALLKSCEIFQSLSKLWMEPYFIQSWSHSSRWMEY